MRNEVIFDSRGIPDIMVVFTPDELGLPAEIRGKAVKEYAISKYPNTLIGGVPYSMPYQQPAVNINHDEAIRLCEAKGPGWHLLTNDEWAALAHQSRKNGTLPRGNTDCGKSHSHPEETGTTYKDASGSSKTLTGSGNWPTPRSRKLRKSWPLLNVATKTAPVFSPVNSRNTSRRCRTRPPRPRRATACCPARSRGNMAAGK